MTYDDVSFDDSKYACQPLTQDNWGDFEKLMGKNGGYGGCWCMSFRGTRKDYRSNRGDGNRLRLKEIMAEQNPVGLLAYCGEAPVGWCAVAPRLDYAALARSRNYKALDKKICWSITCFYTAKDFRRSGISRFLIKQTLIYARDHGAELVEAYPIFPNRDKIRDDEGYTGFYKDFLEVGFIEAARRSNTSPLMRYIFPIK